MTGLLRNTWRQWRRYWASSLVMVVGAAVGTAVVIFTLGTSLDRAIRSVAVTPTDLAQTASLAIRSPGRLDPQLLFRAAAETKGLVSLAVDEPFNVAPMNGRPGMAYATVRSGESWHPPLTAGRYLDEGDGRPEAEPVLVIGQNLAQAWFAAADPTGRTVDLGLRGRPVTFRVVGVVGVPNGYTVWDDRVILPGRFDQGRKVRQFTIKAAGSADVNGVRAELLKALQRQSPGLELVSAPPTVTAGSEEAKAAIVAFAMALVVLIVAGINSGNLALFWAWRRRREMGIRQALGASPGRVVRMVMSEVLLLNLLGSGVGLLVYAAVREWTTLGEFMPLHLAHVAVGLGAGLVAGFFAGLVPAMAVARMEPANAIKQGG